MATMGSCETRAEEQRSVMPVPENWIETFVTELLNRGVRVIAPVECNGTAQFEPVSAASEIATDYLNTLVPAKKVLFPRSEVLLEFATGKQDVDFEPATRDAAPTVVVGCRPCDAAAVERLTTVFGWDYDDELYLARLRDTTFVTLACMEPDRDCFCTSVGLGPASAEGSDLLVEKVGDGLSVTVVTEKGEKLLGDGAQSAADEQSADAPAEEKTSPEPKFDVDAVKQWLDDNFTDGLWEEIGLRCVGCGVCSFLCPTCHCFDIVDEADWRRGERRRNWDSCAFSLFTLHASGHNPRPDQGARFRQRVMHKFKYFPERFGQMGCVGCGRCIRHCPAGQDLVRILQRMK
jgi:ferredoxin